MNKTNDLSLAPTITLLRAHLKSQATLLGALIIAIIIAFVGMALPTVLDFNARVHASRLNEIEATK